MFIVCLLFLSEIFSQNYPIVSTNQITCWDNRDEISTPSTGSFFGQNCNFNTNSMSYIDNSDGTISDVLTGLMWQKDKGNKMTYTSAQSGASTFNLGGYNDWRLPSVKELYSLIGFFGRDLSPDADDPGDAVPFIDTSTFEFEYGDLNSGERLIDSQWATSSIYVSTVMQGATCMFGLNFADGRIKCYPTQGGKLYFVVYVRGNINYGVNDFNDNGDGTITDTSTGLMWSKTDSLIGMDWEDALSFSQTKNGENYLGYNDWRLPHSKELHSIVDYTRSPDTTQSPAINAIFDSTSITNEEGIQDWGYYWTSTTHGISGHGTHSGGSGVYICFGRCLGYMNLEWLDVHGAGAQRSDPKEGDPIPTGRGPQGDVVRVNNYVRLVRTKIDDTSDDTPNDTNDDDTSDDTPNDTTDDDTSDDTPNDTNDDDTSDDSPNDTPNDTTDDDTSDDTPNDTTDDTSTTTSNGNIGTLMGTIFGIIGGVVLLVGSLGISICQTCLEGFDFETQCQNCLNGHVRQDDECVLPDQEQGSGLPLEIIIPSSVGGALVIVAVIVIIIVFILVILCLSRKKKDQNERMNILMDEVDVVKDTTPSIKSVSGKTPTSFQQKFQKVNDVLKDLGLEEFADQFSEDGVLFDDLKTLTEEDIVRLIPKKIPRNRFTKWLVRVKKEKKKKKFSEKMIDPEMVQEGKTLKQGAFGIVKTGVLNLGLKQYKEVVISNDSLRHSFIHEIKIMSDLNNHNILECFGGFFIEEKNKGAMILELCEKGDLYTYKKVCNRSQRMDMLLSICKGMTYLHSQGVVHRDLKTPNVLVTKDDNVKICDFGTSKSEESVGNTFCGTIEYLAPEQIDTSLMTDKKLIDVYSFSVIFWELWTGKDPFSELRKKHTGNQITLANDITENEFRPTMEDDCSEMPTAMKQLMIQCWAKYPEQRPQSFKSIERKLEKYIKQWKEQKDESSEGEEDESSEGEEDESSEGESEYSSSSED